MPEKRVVVTGLGMLSSNGIGKDAFWENTFSGVSGIKPISLFDSAEFATKDAGEIRDFLPEYFLGAKGLRTLDRSTKLVLSASKLALDDARFTISETNADECGVVIATTLGSISSISDFDREAFVEGARYVNPALFPNTVINSPASQVSIRFNIRAFNSTISTGFSASLDALNYAADLLKAGRAKIVLAGAVEELCIQFFLGFYKTGCLKEITLGEGASVLVLEELNSALARGAKIYCEIIGFGSSFSPDAIDPEKAIRLAIEASGITAQEIDCIFLAANSSRAVDLPEARAIKSVFPEDAKKIYTCAIKPLIGETYSASGAFAAAAAIGAIERQAIPPTIGYAEKKEPRFNFVVNQGFRAKVDKVLINAFGKSGTSSSLVLSRFQG